MTDLFEFTAGTSPLLISVPHAGTHVPGEIAAQLTDAGRQLADTDWFVDRLYAFATELDASMLVATHSRYVIDLNRPPDGADLYPGRDTPGLVPVHTFAGEPIWAGDAPDTAEIDERRRAYWQPYHDKIARTLEALRQEHGRAVLWDAHSIVSRAPRLFEGQLPDLNLGTAGGASCAAPLRTALAERAADSGHTHVLDGRFRGGYITRHYGAPDRGIDAVQLELAQSTYMDEAAVIYDERRAGALAETLRTLLVCARDGQCE